MATFLLSGGETWPRIGNMVAFLLSVGVSGSGYFSSVSFFIYLALFSFLKLPVGVGLCPGLRTGLASFTPRRVSAGGSVPDWERASPLLHPRVGFRLRPGLRAGLSSYMSPCASLTWVHSPRA